jgi:hypothetical protein
MRVLVLSDVHGNVAALEAVAAAAREWVVQGNHDRALADDVPPGCRPQFEELARAVAPLGQRQLTAEGLAWLGALPRQAGLRKKWSMSSASCCGPATSPRDRTPVAMSRRGLDRTGWQR